MAPIVTAIIRQPLAVMRHQVTAAEYRRCVEAKACSRADRDTAADRPVVGVNWHDAQSYASWLSRETGTGFRLPTDEEWVYAAASRFIDDALPDALYDGDPGHRALALYDRRARRDEVADKAPRPIGSFGVNENGILDLAGNVGEWTDTCFVRTNLDGRDSAVVSISNCVVRVVEGRHRAYLPSFMRDARAGGCALAAPPDNLGFRLVRDGTRWRGLHLMLAEMRRIAGVGAHL